MGLLDRLRNAFGQRSISTVQLIQENGTRYMAWHGGLYDADIVPVSDQKQRLWASW